MHLRRILLLDNYDSFTFNLFHYLLNEGIDVDVVKNDEIELSTVLSYDAIVLSPGPGLPKESGRLMDVLSLAVGKVPVLGVCLGMQAMAEYLGGRLENQKSVQHGVQVDVSHNNSCVLFNAIPQNFKVGLYHSWMVNGQFGDFEVCSTSSAGVVMAIQNKALKLYGVQFHPESVMTPNGPEIVSNFLSII